MKIIEGSSDDTDYSKDRDETTEQKKREPQAAAAAATVRSCCMRSSHSGISLNGVGS